MFMKYFKEKKSFDINLKNSEKYKFGGVGATVDQNTYRATDTTREKKKVVIFRIYIFLISLFRELMSVTTFVNIHVFNMNL